MIFKVKTFTSIAQKVQFNFGKYNIRRARTYHDIELIEFKKALKQKRKEVIDDYWKRQTDIENYEIGRNSSNCRQIYD